MNPAVIGKIADMVKHIADLAKTVVESSDPEKYSNSVESLSHGVNDTYDQMRQLIINSEKFSEEEKLERLQTLAQQEMATKERCGEAIKGNREHVAGIAMEIVKGFLTCGISFVPGIAKNFKESKNDTKAILDNGAEVLELPVAEDVTV